MSDSQQLLQKALTGYGDRLGVGSTVMDTARVNATRAARVSFAVPDDVVRSLRRRQQRPGKAIIVFIPGDVIHEMESP